VTSLSFGRSNGGGVDCFVITVTSSIRLWGNQRVTFVIVVVIVPFLVEPIIKKIKFSGSGSMQSRNAAKFAL
jgi:hypothetical protein